MTAGGKPDWKEAQHYRANLSRAVHEVEIIVDATYED